MMIIGVRTFPAHNLPPDGTSFAQITLGSRLSNIIGSYSYWNMQFYQSEGAYVTYEMSVPRGASVGFYARRNALPTHTHYDFMEILRGFKARSKRSSPVIIFYLILIPFFLSFFLLAQIHIQVPHMAHTFNGLSSLKNIILTRVFSSFSSEQEEHFLSIS